MNWRRKVKIREGERRVETCWVRRKGEEEIGGEGIERMREVVVKGRIEREMIVGEALKVSWKGTWKAIETDRKIEVEGGEGSFKEICN